MRKKNTVTKTKEKPIVKSQAYCKPFPGAKAFYNEQLNYKKIKKQSEVFQNATKFRPIKFNGMFYIVGDTSAFDALIEVLYFSYRSLKGCKELCDEICSPKDTENNVIQLLKDFFLKQNYANFYTKRFHILLENEFLKESKQCKSYINIGTLVSKLMEKFCYLIEIFTCSLCSSNFSQKEAVLSILQYGNFENFELKNLQKHVILYLKNKMTYATCEKCLQQNLKGEQYLIGPFLIIDVSVTSVYGLLTEAPETLELFIHTYDLTGIIVSKLLNDVFSKYVAYCRDLTNAWYKHDDTQDHVSRVKDNSKQKISMLIYALRCGKKIS